MSQWLIPLRFEECELLLERCHRTSNRGTAEDLCQANGSDQASVLAGGVIQKGGKARGYKSGCVREKWSFKSIFVIDLEVV